MISFPISAHAEPTKVIHILNSHYVSRDDYAADLKSSTGKPLTNDQINREYLTLIDDVRTIQKQQMKLLRGLITKHNLKAVYVEKLTEKNHKGILDFLESMKKYKRTRKPSKDRLDRLIEAQHQLDLLHVGATARLVVSGELKKIVPAEDSKAMEAANPVRPDGTVVFDLKIAHAREDELARNLIKADGVVVIILGRGQTWLITLNESAGTANMSECRCRSIGRL